MSGDVIEIGKMKEINVEEIKKKYAIHLSGKPIREALFFKKLQEIKGWSQTKIAEEVGTSQSDVSRKMRLLNLTPKLQERLKKGEITSSKGAKLSTLPKDIQKEFEDKSHFTLKDIQERKRQYHISQEVKDVLNTPMPTATPEKEAETEEETEEIKETKMVTCPNCGEKFEVNRG